MGQKGVKKALTRARILEAASRGFRRFGFSGVGVDGLAKSAGVTSGAFYAHLGSKQAAFKQALEEGLNEVIETIPAIQQQQGDQWVEFFCDYYLSKSHREDMECGCAMASLTPEVIRMDESTQGVFQTKMDEIVMLIAQGLPGEELEQRTSQAWKLLSILIGGLNLARAVENESKAEHLAQLFKQSAMQVVRG